MTHKVQIISGREIAPAFEYGMWRATVNGVQYCSQTEDGLLRALGQHLSIEKRVVPPPAPPVDPIRQACRLFRDSRTTISEKQEILQFIRAHAGEDSECAKICTALTIQGLPSREARDITRKLGRSDFLDVTYDEIAQYAPNVVVRNKLIHELVERLKC